MATPTIPNGEEYFFPVVYSGNGQGQRVGKFVPFTDSGTIANSCMFDNAGSCISNSKTYGGAGTSSRKFTFSCWFKLGADCHSWYIVDIFQLCFNVGGETGKYFALFITISISKLFSYIVTILLMI